MKGMFMVNKDLVSVMQDKVCFRGLLMVILMKYIQTILKFWIWVKKRNFVEVYEEIFEYEGGGVL